MSGQFAIKGYILQSLVALLESFNGDWLTISVEPNDESEKVDIRWTYADGSKKVVQVKSSINRMTLSKIRKWARELRLGTLDAKEYELFLIGEIDNNIKKEVEGVTINKKSYSVSDFKDIIYSRLNSFFQTKNISPIDSNTGTLFINSLNHEILEDSIKGKEVNREEFESKLLKKLENLKKYSENNLYSHIILPTQNNSDTIENTIIKNILKLIGWKNLLTSKKSISVFNKKLDKDEKFEIDFWGTRESPLKNNMEDVIYINYDIYNQYPIVDYQKELRKDIYAFEKVREQLIENEEISTKGLIEHYIQFVLSFKESEQGVKMPYLSDNFKSANLNKNIIYYTVDNKQILFIISSILTAKAYREDIETKFLYPITEDNSKNDKIGKRETYLPPQYINSSILPIIKEDKDRISVLLFCSDSYNRERLKKIIWLLIRLTSGLANEYKIYFPDYKQDSHHNEVIEIIRSYRNAELRERLEVRRLELSDSIRKISFITEKSSTIINEDVGEATASSLKIQSYLTEYLPYGDSIKPFLNSDAIKSEDLKTFLKSKGVLFKTADKTKIVQLMTSMLFSPTDMESIIEIVNVSENLPSSSFVQFALTNENQEIPNLFSDNMINRTLLEKDLKAKIVSVEQKLPDNNQGIYEYLVNLEEENPNKQALVSTTFSTAKVSAKVNSDTKKIEINKEYNSTPARLLTQRIVNQLYEKLLERNKIENEAIEIKFSDFANKDRINFLFSFIDTESSNIFKASNVKSFKYMYDETQELPLECQDKKGKECTIRFKGTNLEGIKEVQEDNIKEIILGEEIVIEYKYEFQKILGLYEVTMNFSGALTNKPIIDGVFNYKRKYTIDKNKEEVSNLQKFETALKDEFEKMLKEKLQLFGKI